MNLMSTSTALLEHTDYRPEFINDGMKYCPMSTATTHIGSDCACSGGHSRVWSRFGQWFQGRMQNLLMGGAPPINKFCIRPLNN